MSTLPYADIKSRGAPDFYFAINATFRFIHRRCGRAGLDRWLAGMARDYFAPVNRCWRVGGLPAVAAYWRDFFEAEPGALVSVSETGGRVVVRVDRCPAIAHLRAARRAIVPFYCRHCAVLGVARAAAAGLSMRLVGGGGACVHYYGPAGAEVQDPAAIREAR